MRRVLARAFSTAFSASFSVAFSVAFLGAALMAGCALEPLDIRAFGVMSGAGGAGGAGDTGGAGGGPAPACLTDGDCDDGKPCTADRCAAGTCATEPMQAGKACGDADICNGDEICDGAGECVSAIPAAVDDGDACTVDACDPASGDVTHTKSDPACVGWKPVPLEGAPVARLRHTAVWTGARMIVWGGSVEGKPPLATATGGVYDPALRTWAPTSMVGAPPPRHSHSAAWTGSRMLVWGGFGETEYETGGGIYDPETNTWAPMSLVGAPSGRTGHSAVWTGEELIVWGGINDGATLNTGARYDPKTDTWTALPSSGAPYHRFNHSAVWAGSRMIVWGGNNKFDWLNDGVSFDPAQGTWMGSTSFAGAPEVRESHTALWTGSRMLVWGGWNGGPYLNTGGIFDPSSGQGGAWTAMNEAGAPTPRINHAAVWTGSSMVVWGGCGGDSCSTILGDGGVWTPDAAGGAWMPIPENPALSPRRLHTAVWTGSDVIVWGGRDAANVLGTGAQAALP